MQESVLDTSPVIIQTGVRYNSGNPATKPLLEYANCGITGVYTHSVAPERQHIVVYKVYSYMIVYKNNGTEYMDYWSPSTYSQEQEYYFVNEGSDGLAFSIFLDGINDAYAYISETGEILFAGRNSIYYGHRNISELN